jgi:hypothetical protein
MSAVPAAAYLVEFGAEDGIEPGAPRPAAMTPASLAARLDEAHARGIEAGRDAAKAACEARLGEAAQAFEQQLAGERQAWAADEGERLAQGLHTGLAELEARIAGTAAHLLKPFLIAKLREQAIAELGTSLDVLLMKDAGLVLSVSGPADLLAALRGKLDGTGVRATYVPNGDCEVRVSVGQTTIETHLGAWLEKIEGAAP